MARGNEGSGVTDADQQLLGKREEGGQIKRGEQRIRERRKEEVWRWSEKTVGGDEGQGRCWIDGWMSRDVKRNRGEGRDEEIKARRRPSGSYKAIYIQLNYI